MDMRAQTKFIDGILHILQDLRLLSQLLGPIWVEIEAERVEVGVHVATAAIMSVVRSNDRALDSIAWEQDCLLTNPDMCSCAKYLPGHRVCRIS